MSLLAVAMAASRVCSSLRACARRREREEACRMFSAREGVWHGSSFYSKGRAKRNQRDGTTCQAANGAAETHIFEIRVVVKTLWIGPSDNDRTNLKAELAVPSIQSEELVENCGIYRTN
jgi:hypothetical protein